LIGTASNKFLARLKKAGLFVYSYPSIFSIVFLLLLTFLVSSLPVYAGDEPLYRSAVADYRAKNYDRARQKFESYCKNYQDKADAFYYLALINYQQGRNTEAQNGYKFVIKNFAGSTAATLSAQGLAQLEQSFIPGQASLPKETWVPFVRRDRSIVVEAKVNNHTLPMVFDTGAERCAFSIAQFRKLGLPVPVGPPAGLSLGVGTAEPMPIWSAKVDLVVGRIERHGFTVMVGDMALTTPLLGQDFFTGMQYTIDATNNVITFKKRDAAEGTIIASAGSGTAPGMSVDTAGKYVYTVPFTLLGECAVVKVLVNGHELPMVFDTGAEGCVLSSEQAKEAAVTFSNKSFEISGIGGSTMASYGLVDTIKLGPIEKNHMRIPVTAKMGIKQSLLGQDFLRGWHYTIDKAASVIRFTQASGANNY